MLCLRNLVQKLDRVIQKGSSVFELYFEMEYYGFDSIFLCPFFMLIFEPQSKFYRIVPFSYVDFR